MSESGMLTRLLRLRWAWIALLILVLPISLFGAVAAFKGLYNDILDWLPARFESTQQLVRFASIFGSDEILMISWPGCTFEDDRIPEFREELLSPVDLGYGTYPLFRLVITGPEIREYFQSKPLSMTEEEATQRMGGWVASRDGQTTCMIALVSEAGGYNRRASVDHVFATADKVAGLSSDDIHVAGPTIEGVSIDEASGTNLLELNLASYAVCLVIMLICLRNVRATILVFLLALFNEQLCMALIHYTGSHMDSILLLSANLTFVLTIAVGIHLVNYYRDAIQKLPPKQALGDACHAAWKPTALATLTTALGLISLAVSDIKPIKKFGMYSAVAICVGMLITLLYIAVHFDIWPLRRRPARNTTDRGGKEHAFDHWVGFLATAKWPIIVGAVAVIVVSSFGVRNLRTSVGLDELLSEDARVIHDYHWLEESIGPLIPVEVLLVMPPADEKGLLKQFHTVHRVHQAVSQIDLDNATISAATFSPEPPSNQGGVRQLAQKIVFRRKLMEGRTELANLGYLKSTPEANFWRITIRTDSKNRRNYGVLLTELRERVGSELASISDEQVTEVVVSGSIPVIFQTQEHLLKDLIQSFVLAFALVGLTLMLLFRNVLCGAICMIPNLLPSATVFGLMGWLDRPVEIGSILTASAALGVAVDDSLHFITWFRRRLQQGSSVRDAVAYAYHRCGLAMLQTTMVCGLGLAVFVFSPFAPIARFGVFMAALLALALVADLLLLPAILLSPLGRWFVPRSVRGGATGNDGHSEDSVDVVDQPMVEAPLQ